MKLLTKLQSLVGISLLAGVLTTQVFAQVSTKRLTCVDTFWGKEILFTVHFQGNSVILELKGHTYRVPYDFAFVSQDGERWSVYSNQEIRVSTTIPHDKYVSVSNSSGQQIAGGRNCN